MSNQFSYEVITVNKPEYNVNIGNTPGKFALSVYKNNGIDFIYLFFF